MRASLGLRIKSKTLFMSNDIGGLTVACCNTATVNMMMAVGERKTQPSLICRSFLNIYNLYVRAILGPRGWSAEFV